MKKFSVISLFSGAMGLDIGINFDNNFNILACVEQNLSFCKTIEINKGNGYLNKDLQIFNFDINELSPVMLMGKLGLKPGDLDLLVGGPPCQSFSTAGKRQSIQDHRGTLLWKFLKFVEVLRPKFFLMENIRGLLSSSLLHRKIANRTINGGLKLLPEEEPGSVIVKFLDDLRGTTNSEYRLDAFEVNAVNYGGPQIRERVLFFGNKYNIKSSFPSPTHTNPLAIKNNLLIPTNLRPWSTLRNAIYGLNDKSPEIMDFSPRKKAYLDLIPPGGNWRSLPEELQKESMGKAYWAKGGRSGWWRRLTFACLVQHTLRYQAMPVLHCAILRKLGP
jgi:DNA (cytosine-5)-methyltransferase 1